jgi:adhesin/invasin
VLDAAGNVYAALYGFTNPLASGNLFITGFSIIKIEPVGPPPLLSPDGVVSSAGFTSGITPGGLVSIFGTGLTSTEGLSTASSFPLPTMLGDTSVWFGDEPAPMIASFKSGAREQLNVQVPLKGNPDQVIVRRGRALGFSIGAGNRSINNLPRPGIFVNDNRQPAITHADNSLVTAANPVRGGETIVIYATGLGSVDPPVVSGAAAPQSLLSRTVAAATVTVGGQNARVEFAGLTPGYAGLYQVNAVVPALAPGSAPVVIRMTPGYSSAPVSIAVE